MPKSLTFGDRYGHELKEQPGEVDDDHDSTYNPDSDNEFNQSDDEYSSSDYTLSDDEDNDNDDDDSLIPATNVQTLSGPSTGVDHSPPRHKC